MKELRIKRSTFLTIGEKLDSLNKGSMNSPGFHSELPSGTFFRRDLEAEGIDAQLVIVESPLNGYVTDTKCVTTYQVVQVDELTVKFDPIKEEIFANLWKADQDVEAH